ncbi:DEAD/DEAH box helicase [Pseudonocardia yuanmonensis]|uniref:DEAD/DEAH box helicase n=1 Tax=Pseudonocardia yuanmonensis TaxID=1095914 RepID=UPI0031E89111
MEALARRADEDLPVLAEVALGAPPRAKLMDHLIDPMREQWLPTLGAQDLAEIVNLVQHGLTGDARDEVLRTTQERVDFLRARRRTDNFKAVLRREFIARNKDRRPVLTTSAPQSERDASEWRITGAGATDPREPYPHQREAWSAMDALLDDDASDDRGGLLILPTGAGKTYTMVRWLLQRMSKDADLTVLWIADRQELVEQAAWTFVEVGRSLPLGVERTLRRIHSGANVATTLASEALDIAVVTRQSLRGKFDAGTRKRIQKFVGGRRTIVVIDEAHHAIAPTYAQVLTLLDDLCQPMLVGLTATPWPSGYGGTMELRQRFPRVLAKVDPAELVRSGVLARPVHHSVETAQRVELSDEERTQLGKGDLTADLLRRFDVARRNDLIVETWSNRREEWGKTLVFAVNIAHADHLGRLFEEQGAPTLVVHTRSGRARGEVLDEFREATQPTVLVSVGMLTEGVDLPDARTVFLARPTTSRILLRQMIGRVLRGPRAGGEALAHIVDVRDKWDEDVDVLRPIEIPLGTGQPEPPRGETDGLHRLPRIVDEASGVDVPEDVVARVLRACVERHRGSSTVPMVRSLRLTGFYRLDELSPPVFDHTQRRYEALVESEVAGNHVSVAKAMESFEDLPIPRPLRRDVEAVLDFVRSQGVAPPLEPLQVMVDVRAIAADLADRAMSPLDQHAWLKERFETSLARAVYPSFQAFDEAVHQALFALASPGRIDPEDVRPGSGGEKLVAVAERDLSVLLDRVRTRAQELVADEDPVYRDLLGTRLDIGWTRDVDRTAFARWAPRMAGRRRGEPKIWVSSMLRVDPAQVPDGVLEYLIWHEVVHHLLPGQGHDAGFRRLEALWPESASHDYFLDTLGERFDLTA